MSDIQTICAAVVFCVFLLGMAVSEGYDHYLDHKMPIEQTKILKK